LHFLHTGLTLIVYAHHGSGLYFGVRLPFGKVLRIYGYFLSMSQNSASEVISVVPQSRFGI
jgi:hypothetical protein